MLQRMIVVSKPSHHVDGDVFEDAVKETFDSCSPGAVGIRDDQPVGEVDGLMSYRFETNGSITQKEVSCFYLTLANEIGGQGLTIRFEA